MKEGTTKKVKQEEAACTNGEEKKLHANGEKEARINGDAVEDAKKMEVER